MLARRGISVGRKWAERMMRGAEFQGAFLRKRWRIASTRTDPRAAPAPDLVERIFTVDQPNRLWVADATRIPCGQGAFWLAAVREALSNSDRGLEDLGPLRRRAGVVRLEFAVRSRDIRDGKLIHHSDRGSIHTAIRFANRLGRNGVAQSIGSVGDSYDNALMENFFSTLKTELVYRRAWRTRDEAENALLAYTDGWYNSQRIQKKLGWRSPDEFEASYHHPVPAGT
ncbi:IS3 family transposase [Nocardia carnea]|uniref:IS3 family transposase n=1 Tax=Nocardia carnea TaxID=37328 RepID=UPI002457B232|nr:IS3 family transposase [Nocardia carnea]